MSAVLGTAEEQIDFAAGDASASLTIPAQASSLRKGGHVLLQNHPCKVSEMSTSKPGKHGHAKVKLIAYDIFTDKKYEDVKPAHAVVEVPVVTRKEYLIIDVDDNDAKDAAVAAAGESGFLSLFVMETGATRDDLKCPVGELGIRVRDLFKNSKGDIFVVVLGAMNVEMVMDAREAEKM